MSYLLALAVSLGIVSQDATIADLPASWGASWGEEG
jgi:hypothetical protein